MIKVLVDDQRSGTSEASGGKDSMMSFFLLSVIITAAVIFALAGFMCYQGKVVVESADTVIDFLDDRPPGVYVPPPFAERTCPARSSPSARPGGACAVCIPHVCAQRCLADCCCRGARAPGCAGTQAATGPHAWARPAPDEHALRSAVLRLCARMHASRLAAACAFLCMWCAVTGLARCRCAATTCAGA